MVCVCVFVCLCRRDRCRALRVDGLRRCVVACVPVEGSVILHDCADSKFFFAARQVRLHTSRECDFYLRTLSRPIIEHCDRVRFAPYTLSYAGLEDGMRGAGLHSDRDAARVAQLCTMWSNVDDFGWHKLQQSPHWRVIPAAERWQSEQLPASLRERGMVIVAPPADLAGDGGGGYMESAAATALAAMPWPSDAPAAAAPAAPAPAGDDDDDEI
jgi:hypothetical protein